MLNIHGRTLMQQIAELRSAEDFFIFFLLPYDENVVNVCRLHIMKRMGEYLAKTDFDGERDDDIFLTIRQHLKAAYLDFVESSPLEEKVFKVFTDKAREVEARFVPMGELAIAAE